MRINESVFKYQKALLRIVGSLLPIVILLLPMEPPLRSVGAIDLSEMNLAPPNPHPPLLAGNPATFNLVLGEDLAEGAGAPMLFRDLKQQDKSAYLEAAHSSGQIRKRPYRYTKTLAIPIGTYNRVNRCNLTLILDEKLRSKPLECETLLDNAAARFVFEETLSPGVYAASLESTASTMENGVSPYLRWSETTGQYWVVPFVWSEPMTTLAILANWSRSEPSFALIYCISIIGLLVLLIRRHNLAATWIWAMPFVSILMAATVITRPFSGHDETLHIELLHRAATGGVTDREAFFEETRSKMIAADFFRLHQVAPQRPKDCPHRIIGGCANKRSTRFYAGLSPVLNLARPDWWTTDRMLWAGRIFNLASLFLVFSVVGLTFGRGTLKATLVIACFTGAVVAQVPSITNDIVMYSIGFFGLACLSSPIFGMSKGRSLSAIFLLAGLLALGSRTDRSWTSGIPTILSIPLVLASMLKPPSQQPSNRKRDRTLTAALFVIGIGLAVFLAVSAGPELSKESKLIGDLRLPADLRMLAGLEQLTLQEARRGLHHYFKSLFGTFVWGHSLYANWVYATLTLGWLAATTAGIWVLGLRRERKWVAGLTAGILGITFGCQIVAIISIIATRMSAPDIVWQSYASARLTAPGLAAILAPAMIAARTALERPFSAHWIFRGTCAWSFVLVGYYLPKFYLADLY